jgi:hypothetical protein
VGGEKHLKYPWGGLRKQNYRPTKRDCLDNVVAAELGNRAQKVTSSPNCRGVKEPTNGDNYNEEPNSPKIRKSLII